MFTPPWLVRMLPRRLTFPGDGSPAANVAVSMTVSGSSKSQNSKEGVCRRQDTKPDGNIHRKEADERSWGTSASIYQLVTTGRHWRAAPTRLTPTTQELLPQDTEKDSSLFQFERKKETFQLGLVPSLNLQWSNLTAAPSRHVSVTNSQRTLTVSLINTYDIDNSPEQRHSRFDCVHF